MSRLSAILRRLEAVDTAALCDADKSAGYNAVQVMASNMSLRTRTSSCIANNKKMIGIARTIQLTESNDFLAVLRGLHDAEKGEVLCVNTMGSCKAVAGGLFLTEAERKGLSGIIIDGAVRDISTMKESNIQCYSSSINPYSGSIQSLGETQMTITCGGVQISPGDVVIGDADGVIIANIDSIENILDAAEAIVAKEAEIMDAMKDGESLHSLTNYAEHVARLQKGQASTLQFK